MTKIVGISGSLRRGSWNTALLRAAAELAPKNVECIVETCHGIPLYDGDVEAAGIPARVQELKEVVAGADGLILCTPEYNNSLPGVFKNTIDWLTRPPSDVPRVFGGKAVAIMGASTGGFGTILSQAAWLPVLRTLGTKPWFGGRLQVARAAASFNESGQLTDDALREKLRQFMAGFAAFIDAP